MSFTARTVVHSYQNGDGTAASGKWTFDLSGAMTNSGVTIIPSEVTAQLDSSGDLTVSLAANDDSGTYPQGVQWQATRRILGAETVTYSITVPSAGSGDVDLGSLIPGSAQVN